MKQYTLLATLLLALTSAAAIATPTISSLPAETAGVDQPGYLYTDESSAILIQLTKTGRTVNGQLQLFRALMRERPARMKTGTYILDGTTDGRSVVLTIKSQDWTAIFNFLGGRRLTGTLDSHRLSLVWPSNDGALQTTTFRRSTVAGYNRAVADFRQRIQRINVLYEAEIAEARRRQAVVDANKGVIEAGIELGDAIKDANAISYADVMKRYDEIWLKMQAEFKAIEEKAQPGIDSYQHSKLEYGLSGLSYRISNMEYARSSLGYKLEGGGGVNDKIQAIEDASKNLTASWRRLQQAVAANIAGVPKPSVTADDITHAVDLARSEINKATAARDATVKQAETYHKRADDLYKQAKQIVDQVRHIKR